MTDVNLLIGKNASGKSTVLEAIYVASARISPTDQINEARKLDYVFRRRTGRGCWSTSRDTPWFLMDIDEPIEIHVSSTGNRELLFALFHTDSEGKAWIRVIDDHETFYWNYHSNQVMERWKPNLVYSTLPPLKLKEIKHKYADMANILSNVVLIDKWLLFRPNLIEHQIWGKLLAKRLDKKITELLRKEFERDAEDLTYMPIGGMNVLAVKLSDTTVRVDDLGDGARNAVLIAAILLTLRNTIVLFEEPEIHQHSAGLRVLLDFMIRVAKEKGLQLIISAHSAELVEMFKRICDSYNVNMRAFFLKRNKKGFVNVRTLEKLDADALKKIGFM